MKIKQLEQEIQDEIIRTLQAAGFRVRHTNTHGVRGKTGVSKGVPDLLVTHQAFGVGICLGLEVKKPHGWKWSSYEQYEAWRLGDTYVVHSALSALSVARDRLMYFNAQDCYIQRCTGLLNQLPQVEIDARPFEKPPKVAI